MRNPADAAMPYLNQIPQVSQQGYNPYIQQGQRAGGVLEGQFSPMATNPTEYLQSLLEQYQPSRSYQLKRDEALRAAGNTAAAGGMRGSLQDIEGESRLADSLLGEDMQQWLQNVLGIQGIGLEGEKGLFDTGYNATQGLTSDLTNTLGTQASLAFQGQREKNQRKMDLFKGITEALGGIAGFGMPGGGTIGGKLASNLFG